MVVSEVPKLSLQHCPFTASLHITTLRKNWSDGNHLGLCFLKYNSNPKRVAMGKIALCDNIFERNKIHLQIVYFFLGFK